MKSQIIRDLIEIIRQCLWILSGDPRFAKKVLKKIEEAEEIIK